MTYVATSTIRTNMITLYNIIYVTYATTSTIRTNMVTLSNIIYVTYVTARRHIERSMTGLASVDIDLELHEGH